MPTTINNKRQHDIAIAGMWMSNNYGALLTTYGLYTWLNRAGWNPVLIDHANISANLQYFRSATTGIFRDFLDLTGMNVVEYDKNDREWINQQIDRFIVGSDQVWNCEYTGILAPFYLLDFANDDKTKISYASSFGHHIDRTPAAVREIMAAYLKRFNAVSVREDSGVTILENCYGIESVHNIDPVFLCNPDIYDPLTSSAGLFHQDEPYIATYTMDPGEQIRDALLFASSKLNCKLTNIISTQDGAEKNILGLGLDDTHGHVSVADWLNCIKNSRFVITDSFHGMCFAIIYRKPFICIANKARGLSRFSSLLRKLNLEDRLVMSPDEIKTRPELFSPIDYDAVDQLLRDFKIRSENWLSSSLASPGEPVSRRLQSNRSRTYFIAAKIKLLFCQTLFRVVFRLVGGKLKNKMSGIRHRYYSYQCLLSSFLKQVR